MKIDINVVGLRDLKSVGVLPVQKASLTLNFKNMFEPKSQYMIDDVMTQPGQSGSNPTIVTCLEHELMLPIDRVICPSLQCTVHDHIFSGSIQPIIGHFEIDIGKLLYE